MATGAILVTGAAGFIGSHVASALLQRGNAVMGLDNFDSFYARDRKLRNVEELKAHSSSSSTARFTLIEGDFTQRDTLDAIFQRHEISGVVHLGARAGVRPSLADPAGYMHTNVSGTAQVLGAAQRAGVSGIVAASSSSVYGNASHSPFAETQDVSQPISPYAASKRACELLAFAHHHAALSNPKIPQHVAMLRFFTVYGPRQRPDLAIMSFMRAIAKGEPIRMFGDGTTARDYTYIDDIVAGVLAALDRIPEHGYRIWNLGNNKPLSLRDMIAAIERVVGRPAVIQREPMQVGDVERTCADIARSQHELGYAPRITFEEGLRRQWEWLKSQP
jgi:UDP-glucuronate 4-epimerase